MNNIILYRIGLDPKLFMLSHCSFTWCPNMMTPFSSLCPYCRYYMYEFNDANTKFTNKIFANIYSITKIYL